MKTLAQILFIAVLLPINVFAADVAVQISVVDEVTFHSAEIQARTQELEAEGLKVLNAHVAIPRITFLFPRTRLDKKARAALIEQIKKFSFGSEDKIKTLVINVHGGTDEEESQANLQLLGDITEEGVDDQFKEVLDPILPYVAEDMRVVLVSCSTFCGTPESTSRRADSFLQYLRAFKGSLFGAKTPVGFPERSLRILPNRFEAKVYFFAYAFAFPPNLFFQAAANTFSGPTEALISIFGVPALGLLAGHILKVAFKDPYLQWQSDREKINVGALYRREDGKLTEKRVSLAKDEAEVFGLKCEAATVGE